MRDAASPTHDRPIADYGMLADGRSAALVAIDGSVDWWCPDRFDGPSIFARLLDAAGGHWSLRPVDPFRVERRYLDGSLAIQSTVVTDRGAARLTDVLLLAGDASAHDVGRGSPACLARVVEGIEGHIDWTMELVARPDYGRTTVEIRRQDGGLSLSWSDGAMQLLGNAAMEGRRDGVITGDFTLGPGDRRWMCLGATSTAGGDAVDRTVASWRTWSVPHANELWDEPGIATSALVMRGLTDGVTGAIIAAPTTSLPEIVGGAANWDYRYGWLRDASFTVRALSTATCPDETSVYFRWMAGVARSSGEATPVVFRPDGSRDLDEQVLDHLAGWRGSRPVRVGNDAHRQTQLDVPGEILASAALLGPAVLDVELAGFLAGQADLAARRWHEPDSGIWEGREGERHYVSSKVMCWVALDRACRLADHLGHSQDAPRWAAARDTIRQTVLTDGWHAGRLAFTGAFGSDHLDASVLLLPLVGFLPADDERMLATLAAIEGELVSGGLVHRWTGAEDAPFAMCSFWLAECYARAGRVERAIEVLNAARGGANDLGLLAEEIDPGSGELLGNFPQVLSHAGLVNATARIRRAANRGGEVDG